MIVDASKIKDLTVFQRKYNALQMELRDIKGENRRLQGFQRRVELIDAAAAENFAFCQEQGFDVDALMKENKQLKSTINNLMTEKGIYLLQLAELKAKVESSNETEMLKKEVMRLEKLTIEQDDDNFLMLNFIQQTGNSYRYQRFYNQNRGSVSSRIVHSPKVEIYKRSNYKCMQRLELYQNMRTVFEEDENES